MREVVHVDEYIHKNTNYFCMCISEGPIFTWLLLKISWKFRLDVGLRQQCPLLPLSFFFLLSHLLCPTSVDWGHIVFGLSFCLFVCVSVCLSAKTCTLAIPFKLVRLRAFIFRMSIPCDKTFLWVPSSRSLVKVVYQAHCFRKNGCCGGQ